MELEVYKKSDFYEDFIDSRKEYYERETADAYFAERLAEKDELIATLQDTNKVLAHNGVRLNKMLDEKDKEIALLKERICNGDVSRLTWIDDCIAKDKEIEELKQKLGAVNELVKESKELLKESQKMHQRCADGAIKKIRHQKFKRCLAMARWCMTEYLHSKCLDFTNTEQWYWRRWHIRWRNLAKKFKEAK